MYRTAGSKTAFSLIELLVVIAIVGIITAVAIPQYRNYSVRAKVISAMGVFERLTASAKTYYEKNGVFPTAYQLGLTTSTSTPWLVVPATTSQLNPNLNAVYMNTWHSGRQVEIGFVYNMTDFAGYNSGATTPPNVISGTGNFLFISTFVNANSNGTITTICTYRTDYGMTAAIASVYFPSNCQTASGIPGPAPT